MANIKDAISGYVESLKKHDEPIPFSIEEEAVKCPSRFPIVSARDLLKTLHKMGMMLIIKLAATSY